MAIGWLLELELIFLKVRILHHITLVRHKTLLLVLLIDVFILDNFFLVGVGSRGAVHHRLPFEVQQEGTLILFRKVFHTGRHFARPVTQEFKNGGFEASGHLQVASEASFNQ